MPGKKIKPLIPTCLEIEHLAVRLFNVRSGMAVPNIHWGAGVHECDVLYVSKSGWATEIEIKISKADLKKDSSKKHGHKSDKIKHLFFAIPEFLLDCIDMIPERAGIIVVKPYENRDYGFYASVYRSCADNVNAKKWTEKELLNLGRLGCMRIWNLKSTLIGEINIRKHLQKENKELKDGVHKQNHPG